MAALKVEPRASTAPAQLSGAAGRDDTSISAARERVVRVGLVTLRLVAVLLLVYAFRLETRTFFWVLLLATCGFVVSTAIPVGFRLTWFTALSMASIVMVMGPDVSSLVLAIGVLLVVICHLPTTLRWRIVLMVLAGMALAGLRHVGTAAPAFGVAVPVIASMFMFRIALYLYSVHRNRDDLTVTGGLSYFFMLPNICFPLFPIVDSDTYRTSHFRGEEYATYERGIRWIVRGVTHLLIYRIVAHELVIGETWANDLGDVVRHVVTAFMLYVRVSGQFHIIVGILHLFGFQLPETHHRYWLSSSAEDFWRRANIYWKDFMAKCVFFPTYFRLRKHGVRVAMATATVAVFVVTWALHSYQQYWLQGVPLFSGTDASFWAIFGLLMVVGTLRSGRAAATGRVRPRWSIRRGVSTVGTMSLVTVLWSLWVAESFETWIYMWGQTRHSGMDDWLLLGSIVFTGVVVGGYDWGHRSIADQSPRTTPLRPFARSTVAFVVVAFAGAGFVLAPVQHAAPAPAARLIRDLRGEGVPIDQQARHLVGYYQKLDSGTVASTLQPWTLPDTAGMFPIVALGYENRDGFLLKGLTPGLRKTVWGKRWSVNRWGMRDRDYDLVKPPGTFRIAMIGPSIVLGWGVDDEESFEARVEVELDGIARTAGSRIEVLNFSVPGWTVAQEVHAMSELASRFAPDLILYSVHPFGMELLASKLVELLYRGEPVPDPALAALLEETGVRWEMGEMEIKRRLRVIEDRWRLRVAEWAVETSARLNTPIAAMVVRSVHHGGRTTLKPAKRALEATGIRQLDCSSAFDGHDAADLWISPEDDHPNALGHALLADCMIDQLRANPDLLPTWFR